MLKEALVIQDPSQFLKFGIKPDCLYVKMELGIHCALCLNIVLRNNAENCGYLSMYVCS